MTIVKGWNAKQDYTSSSCRHQNPGIQRMAYNRFLNKHQHFYPEKQSISSFFRFLFYFLPLRFGKYASRPYGSFEML
jgi:hypothetical protein